MHSWTWQKGRRVIAGSFFCKRQINLLWFFHEGNGWPTLRFFGLVSIGQKPGIFPDYSQIRNYLPSGAVIQSGFLDWGQIFQDMPVTWKGQGYFSGIIDSALFII
jgi:hypothetical protein